MGRRHRRSSSFNGRDRGRRSQGLIGTLVSGAISTTQNRGAPRPNAYQGAAPSRYQIAPYGYDNPAYQAAQAASYSRRDRPAYDYDTRRGPEPAYDYDTRREYAQPAFRPQGDRYPQRWAEYREMPGPSYARDQPRTSFTRDEAGPAFPRDVAYAPHRAFDEPLRDVAHAPHRAFDEPDEKRRNLYDNPPARRPTAEDEDEGPPPPSYEDATSSMPMQHEAGAASLATSPLREPGLAAESSFSGRPISRSRSATRPVSRW